MANNYSGFSYGGTQYNSTGTPGAYSSNSVAYPAVTNATYANAAAYQSAVAAGSGSYAAGGAAGAAAAGYAGYSGDYSRAPLQAYDSSKTFYQQAASNYNTAAAPTVSKTHYSAPPVKNVTPIDRTHLQNCELANYCNHTRHRIEHVDVVHRPNMPAYRQSLNFGRDENSLEHVEHELRLDDVAVV